MRTFKFILVLWAIFNSLMLSSIYLSQRIEDNITVYAEETTELVPASATVQIEKVNLTERINTVINVDIDYRMFSPNPITTRQILEDQGVQEKHIVAIVDHIIPTESKWDFNSRALTDWHHCDRQVTYTLWGYTQTSNYVEIEDRAGGHYQATCEQYGAITIDSGTTSGLTHIIEQTRVHYGCENYVDWVGEIECVAKIANAGGIFNWAYVPSNLY